MPVRALWDCPQGLLASMPDTELSRAPKRRTPWNVFINTIPDLEHESKSECTGQASAMCIPRMFSDLLLSLSLALPNKKHCFFYEYRTTYPTDRSTHYWNYPMAQEKEDHCKWLARFLAQLLQVCIYVCACTDYLQCSNQELISQDGSFLFSLS